MNCPSTFIPREVTESFRTLVDEAPELHREVFRIFREFNGLMRYFWRDTPWEPSVEVALKILEVYQRVLIDAFWICFELDSSLVNGGHSPKFMADLSFSPLQAIIEAVIKRGHSILIPLGELVQNQCLTQEEKAVRTALVHTKEAMLHAGQDRGLFLTSELRAVEAVHQSPIFPAKFAHQLGTIKRSQNPSMPWADLPTDQIKHYWIALRLWQMDAKKALGQVEAAGAVLGHQVAGIQQFSRAFSNVKARSLCLP